MKGKDDQWGPGLDVDHRYILVRQIDRWGVGQIFEAEHRYTGRAVAIKLVKEGTDRSRTDKHLLRTARAMSMARHPNVLDVLDAGKTADGDAYLVMDLVEGRLLSSLLALRGRLPIMQTVGLALQLCRAMAQFHKAGVLHHDIQPGSVLVIPNRFGEEVVKLFNFQLAEFTESEPQAGDKHIGAPEYAAPERLAGGSGDQRSDIFSLGVLLYESLSGSVPYEGDFDHVCLAHKSRLVVDVSERSPEVGAALSNVVHRALATDPDDRFQRADELANALLAALDRPVEQASILGLSPPKSEGASSRPAPGPSESPSRIPRPQVTAPIPPPPPVPTDPAPSVRAVATEPPQTSPGPAPAAAAAPSRAVAQSSSPTVPAPALPIQAREPPPAASAGAEQRRHARAPYATPVRIIDARGEVVDGRSEDISEGGLLVVSQTQIENGASVSAKFALPPTGRVTTIQATARWVKSSRRIGHAVGLEFQDLPREIRNLIGLYVQLMGGG